jgi:hypothetical protein
MAEFWNPAGFSRSRGLLLSARRGPAESMRVPLCLAVHGHIADSVRDHEPGRVAGSLWRGSGGSGSPNRCFRGSVTAGQARGGSPVIAGHDYLRIAPGICWQTRQRPDGRARHELPLEPRQPAPGRSSRLLAWGGATPSRATRPASDQSAPARAPGAVTYERQLHSPVAASVEGRLCRLPARMSSVRAHRA